MSNLTLFKAIIEVLAVIAVCFGFYYEEKFIKFERKAFIFIKCVFKALFYTVKEKVCINKKGDVISITTLNTDCNDKHKSENGNIRIA